MTTMRALAAEYHIQEDGLATFLDLGRDYDPTAEISEADEQWMREALDVPTGDDREAAIEAARAELDAATKRLAAAVRDGAEHGMAERRLAELSGYARETVRRILGR